MDTILALAGLVVLISVPVILGLIYLELRQRRMFGPRSIISTEHQVNNDTAAIAMSLQAELERLRADVHGALTSVSSDIGRVNELLVREHSFVNHPPAAQAPLAVEPARTDPLQSLAISELYSALSKLDVAFLAVASPILLPGEDYDPEDVIPTEAFLWESWNDVGSAAFHYAEVFSERRIALDAATRDQLNTSLKSIRRCLTQQIYPALTDVDGSIPEESRSLVAQVIATLAADIREARQVLEHAALPNSAH